MVNKEISGGAGNVQQHHTSIVGTAAAGSLWLLFSSQRNFSF
jgi:hypothetical protein